jgi:hypothetical protein
VVVVNVDSTINGSFKTAVLTKDPTESILPLLEDTALLAILLDDFELGQHALIIVFANLAVDPGSKAHRDPIVTTRPVTNCVEIEARREVYSTLEFSFLLCLALVMAAWFMW